MASQAVTTTDNQGGAVAEREAAKPIVVLRHQLERLGDEFRMVLPAHITPEKLQRTVLTAVQNNPDLMDADRQTFLGSCMKAAQDGLLPDGREAALVIFNTKLKRGGVEKWCNAVQYMPMVYGLRKKILQSGEVADLQVGVVYRRELEDGHFRYEVGTVPPLQHKPSFDLKPEEAADDEIVAAYSIATMKDGTKSYEVMRRFEIDKVREVSKTGATRDRNGKAREPKGPWADWFTEMAKKTVMRRHSKTLPMSGDIIDVEARDDAEYAKSVAVTLGGAPQLPASRLDALEAQIQSDAHDPETGELTADTNTDQSSESSTAASPPEAAGKAAADTPNAKDAGSEAVSGGGDPSGLERGDGQAGYDLNAAGAGDEAAIVQKITAAYASATTIIDLRAAEDIERDRIDQLGRDARAEVDEFFNRREAELRRGRR